MPSCEPNLDVCMFIKLGVLAQVKLSSFYMCSRLKLSFVLA